jgi:hypothetical protein
MRDPITTFATKNEFAQFNLDTRLEALSMDVSLEDLLKKKAQSICHAFHGTRDTTVQTIEMRSDAHKGIFPRSLGSNLSLTVGEVLPGDTATLKALQDNYNKHILAMKKKAMAIILQARNLADRKLILDYRIVLLKDLILIAFGITSFILSKASLSYNSNDVVFAQKDIEFVNSISLFAVLCFLLHEHSTNDFEWLWLANMEQKGFDITSSLEAVVKSHILPSTPLKWNFDDLQKEIQFLAEPLQTICNQIIESITQIGPAVTWLYAKDLIYWQNLNGARAQIAAHEEGQSNRNATAATQKARDRSSSTPAKLKKLQDEASKNIKTWKTTV